MRKSSINLDTIARQVEQTIARNRAIYGDLRMEATDGGDGGDGGGDGTGSEAGAEQGGAAAAGAEQGTERGYPENTPVADMTIEQQAAYHKAQSRKREARAKSREDYDAIKAERDKLKQQTESAHDKAIREAKEAGKAEATHANNVDTAKALLRLAIKSRKQDIKDDELAELVDETNLSAFVTENGVDEDKILRRASRAVATTNGTSSNAGPDMGQGNRGGSRVKPGEGGNAEADKRFGKSA